MSQLGYGHISVDLPAEVCSDMTLELVAKGFTAFLMARSLRDYGLMFKTAKGNVVKLFV